MFKAKVSLSHRKFEQIWYEKINDTLNNDILREQEMYLC